MKEIVLSQGKVALVDDEDYEWLMQWKWSLKSWSGIEYALRVVRKTVIRMHRLILNAPSEYIVDHINGNGLDNRRCNLRICTEKENHRNHKLNKRNKAGYTGVAWMKDKRKYRACIYVDGKRLFLGYFDTSEKAALAYNDAATKYFGNFARPNRIMRPVRGR